MNQNLEEKKISGQQIFQGQLLDVRKDIVRLPDGKQSVREWVCHPGATAVLPILKDGSVLLVRQYRYPIGQVTLEIPAGKYDLDNPEKPETCALRELSEETGFELNESDLIFLTKIATTVGFSNEWIDIFLAKDLDETKRQAQHLDEGEFINLEKIPFEKALQLVQEGKIFDVKTIIALCYAKLFFEKI